MHIVFFVIYKIRKILRNKMRDVIMSLDEYKLEKRFTLIIRSVVCSLNFEKQKQERRKIRYVDLVVTLRKRFRILREQSIVITNAFRDIA